MKNSYHFLVVLFILGFTNPLYSQSVPSYVPTNGLVGWWPLDANSNNLVGNGLNGSFNGSYVFSGRNCAQFNNSLLIIPGEPIFNISNFSTSFWVKINSHTGHTGIQFGIPNGPLRWAIGWYPTSVLFAQMTCGGGWGQGNHFTSNVNLNTGEWYYLTIVHSGLTSSLYINSIPIGTLSTAAPLNCWNSSMNLYIGGDIGGGAIEYFDGYMDDFGFWNRALTQQEITNLYNAQLPTPTSLCLPTITTNSPTAIGVDSVVVGGDILNDGGSSIVLRGVCYSTTPNPNMGNTRTEEGSGIGSFTTTLRNLSPSTTYYVRSYAKNSQGVVVYGNEVNFSTATNPPFACGSSTVSDIDGNVYNTVQIGNQCWMQSNLKVSRYRNGNSIPTGLSNSDWVNATSGAYAVYNNDLVNDTLYGKLYNHYAVSDSRDLCPTGWHVPTDGEWTTLETFLGGPGVAVGALKSTATLPTPGGWNPPNTGATNSSGFTAGPGGVRSYTGDFALVGSHGLLWSSSLSGTNPWYRMLHEFLDFRSRYSNYRTNGFSVRCLRD